MLHCSLSPDTQRIALWLWTSLALLPYFLSQSSCFVSAISIPFIHLRDLWCKQINFLGCCSGFYRERYLHLWTLRAEEFEGGHMKALIFSIFGEKKYFMLFYFPGYLRLCTQYNFCQLSVVVGKQTLNICFTLLLRKMGLEIFLVNIFHDSLTVSNVCYNFCYCVICWKIHDSE